MQRKTHLRFHVNTEQFCAVNSNMWLSSTKGATVFVFMGTLIIFLLLTDLCRSTIHTERFAAFPWQQWLCERAIVLRCTYVVCLLCMFLNLLLDITVKYNCVRYCVTYNVKFSLSTP
jgi:hypothetical protein